MLLRIYSWLYQGVKLGSSECRDFLAKFRYVPSAEELAQIGNWRWQQFSENFKQPSESSALKPSLTKSSLSKSNFCPNCGKQLGSLDKFCGGCGSSVS
jgi:membrane protease subunit (stomatin/prohibitin family)